MNNTCPTCGNEYERLGQHWQYNETHVPDITERQHEIITGSLMSDGCMVEGTKNPFLQIKMETKDYLEYLDKELNYISSGVTSAHQDGIYSLRTKTHPQLREYRDWYSSGEKVWPEDILLTSTTLKHLYCGDGTYYTSSYNASIKISMSNEYGNNQKIKKIFKRVDLPEPTIYENKKSDRANKFVCRFTKDESQTLFEYMGEPLPEFRYKWPDQNV